MKKEGKTFKKLRLSRETLRDLKKSDAQRVLGGFIAGSRQSFRQCCHDDSDVTCDCDTI